MLQVNVIMDYRDGIKIKGDKIRMHCTRHVIPSPRESTTQALYCRNDDLSILVDHSLYP